MFDRLKKVFAAAPSPAVDGWGQDRGLVFERLPRGDRLAWTGLVDGRAFRMESSPPSRDYIPQYELRLRVALGIPEDVSVMVLNRPLKQQLEARAYDSFTDTVKTTADLKQTEELRWLSMFGEVGWSSLAPDFWMRYAVLSDSREQAQKWLDAPLVAALMKLPLGPDGGQWPMLMSLTRGSLYLRTGHSRSEVSFLDYFHDLARTAAKSAQSLA